MAANRERYRFLLIWAILSMAAALACSVGQPQPSAISDTPSPLPQRAETGATTEPGLQATPVEEQIQPSPSPTPTAPPPVSSSATLADQRISYPPATFAELPDGRQIPLPGDAQLVPVGEGFLMGFTTQLTEPEIFDFYTIQLNGLGWSLQAPTEARLELPHQIWRQGNSQLRVELQPSDSHQANTVWIQLQLIDTESQVSPTPPPTPQQSAAEPSGWTATNANAQNTRANLSSQLGPPLELNWRWGDGENEAKAVITHQERLFVLTEYGDLLVLSADTGSEIDRRALWPPRELEGFSRGQLAVTGDTLLVQLAVDYFEPGQRYVSTRSWFLAFSLGLEPRWELPLREEEDGDYHLVAVGGLVAISMQSYTSEAWLAVFDAASGKELWKISGEDSPSPRASNGKLLFTPETTFELKTGNVLWQRSAWGDMVYSDGRLLVFSPMDTVALDANTGDVIWYLDDIAASGSTRPMSYAVAHGRVYLIPSGGDNGFGYRPGVIALDAATGKQLWYGFDDASSSAQSIAAVGDSRLLVVTVDYDAGGVYSLHVVNADIGGVEDTISLGDTPPFGLVAVDDQVYLTGARLHAYAQGTPGAQSSLSPTPPPTLVAAPTAIVSEEDGIIPTGAFAVVWERLGGAAGPLGPAMAPAVERQVAWQTFENSLMHWGTENDFGNHDITVMVYGENYDELAGDLWLLLEDGWKEGDTRYSCPEAGPSLGPERGFGLVWCKWAMPQVGAPIEEEWSQQASYQIFVGGRMLWSPDRQGVYVLLNRGDWSFEPVAEE